MAEFHLDTNALIALADPALALFQITSDRIEAGDIAATSAVAWHEFVRGSVTEDDIVRADEIIEGRILSLDREISEIAADLFRKTGSRRASTADCLIATTAILAEALLLTANHDDFKRFEAHGLRLLIQ